MNKMFLIRECKLQCAYSYSCCTELSGLKWEKKGQVEKWHFLTIKNGDTLGEWGKDFIVSLRVMFG